MSLIERGRIIHVGQLQSGVSKAGKNWQKQQFVLETDGQYPKKVSFNLMNDRIAQAQIQMGQTVEIDADAESREYQGKWYTDINAWRVNNLGFVATSAPVQTQAVYQQQAPQGYQQPQYQQDAVAQTNAGNNNPFPQQDSSDLPF